MRGEERFVARFQALSAEIPPHARRRVCRVQVTPVVLGNTSACAEKRFEPPDRSWLGRKYLRMRGEECGPVLKPALPMEIPPHARRRVLASVDEVAVVGNTSACAEKSS